MIANLFPRTESACGPGSLRNIHPSLEGERSGECPLQSISDLEVICFQV